MKCRNEGQDVTVPEQGSLESGSRRRVLGEDAGRNQLWRVGRFVSASGAGSGAWANPANQIALQGSSSNGVTIPGPCAMNCTNRGEVYSFHTNGVNLLLTDGSVQFVRSSISISNLAKLVTRAAGEVVSVSDL